VQTDDPAPPPAHAVFDINAIARNFPASASTMLIDTRLTDEREASSRVFRIYTNVPAHYHATCDEYLLVIAGRGRFFIGDNAPFDIGAGHLLFFKKRIVHAITVLEQPLVFLSVDTPRRDPKDVIFVNPADGTPETFIQTQKLY
jgi:mannose-6-phosphate isomerase-like protein (cupin superfamily)